MTYLRKSGRTEQLLAHQTSAQLPDYLRETYNWAYLNPKTVPWLSSQPVVEAILWGNASRLIQTAIDEVASGQTVLQAAAVYGQFSCELAQKVGPKGHLDIIDVAPIQVETAQNRVAGLDHVHVSIGDARIARPFQYDTVVCFFLLHEVPEEAKVDIVSALLSSAKIGGKIVFVDYHKPSKWHPLKGVMSKVFDWLEPFAKGLWEKEIQDYRIPTDGYVWQKETIFGGLYQKVVVTKG